MKKKKKKSIADTFHAKLRTPWVWLVIVLTVGLTVLFYFSQKPQLVIYAQHTKSLAEYQLLETSLMRSMERVRSGFGADTLLVQSQTMTLREIAVSFCREMEDLRFLGSDIPASNMTVRFEREVLSKVAGMRRYVSARILWHEKWKDVSEKVESLPVETRTPLNALLDFLDYFYCCFYAHIRGNEDFLEFVKHFFVNFRFTKNQATNLRE